MSAENPTISHRTDRRVARTRSALREAFLALVREKGYEGVTVEEITQRANLGRATFYLHYKDKEELLLEQFVELTSDTSRLFAEIPMAADLDGDGGPTYLPLVIIFHHAYANAEMYRTVLRGEKAARVSERLRAIIHEALTAMGQLGDPATGLRLNPDAPVDFLAAYLAGALLGSIAWWLDQPDPAPPDQMAREFWRMLYPGARKVFGV